MSEINRNVELIGLKIGKIFKLINDFITKDELRRFINYTNQFDALFPILNPTAYMKMPYGMVNKAKKRAEILLKVFEVI